MVGAKLDILKITAGETTPKILREDPQERKNKENCVGRETAIHGPRPPPPFGAVMPALGQTAFGQKNPNLARSRIWPEFVFQMTAFGQNCWFARNHPSGPQPLTILPLVRRARRVFEPLDPAAIRWRSSDVGGWHAERELSKPCVNTLEKLSAEAVSSHTARTLPTCTSDTDTRLSDRPARRDSQLRTSLHCPLKWS